MLRRRSRLAHDEKALDFEKIYKREMESSHRAPGELFSRFAALSKPIVHMVAVGRSIGLLRFGLILLRLELTARLCLLRYRLAAVAYIAIGEVGASRRLVRKHTLLYFLVVEYDCTFSLPFSRTIVY